MCIRDRVDGLGVKDLEIGDDFRFGCDRAGDFEFLKAAGQRYGFSVDASTTVEVLGGRVSSTRVRQALADGDFELAEALLGRPFRIAGRVLHGQKLGRQLDAPTANIQLKRRKVPLTGVYLVSCEIDGVIQPGVANIGVRPSVAGDGRAHLEAVSYTHLDVYKRQASVETCPLLCPLSKRPRLAQPMPRRGRLCGDQATV